MNPTGKKLISLFLVFSLMMLSVNLYAKKRGAKLIVTIKDGQRIKGELITVKPNSLLLLNTEGKDVSVGIADIKVIKIVTKKKVLIRLLYGLVISGVVGVLFGFILPLNIDQSWVPEEEDIINIGPIIYGTSGAIIGATTGALLKVIKKIRIEGMSDSEIQEALDYLRKKARIRDYK